jgi:hypothetical protein
VYTCQFRTIKADLRCVVSCKQHFFSDSLITSDVVACLDLCQLPSVVRRTLGPQTKQLGRRWTSA